MEGISFVILIHFYYLIDRSSGIRVTLSALAIFQGCKQKEKVYCLCK